MGWDGKADVALTWLGKAPNSRWMLRNWSNAFWLSYLIIKPSIIRVYTTIDVVAYQTTCAMFPPSSLPTASSCRQFSLSEIQSATNNLSGDLIIGKGSFGYVYKAIIVTESGNTVTVAIKRRNSDSKQGPHEFFTEVTLLSAFRHTHLISLIGYCVDYDANEMILVYEFMINGTLADHIYKNDQNSGYLSWEQRLKICIGVARGLEFLHTGTGINHLIIHRDVKSSNILLDGNYIPKVSDFGLCVKRFGNRPNSPILASVKGTRGYMDPNYCNKHQVSPKVDVYAFGVVLLEVFCGRRSLDFELVDREKSLGLWAKLCISEGVVSRIIDPGLRGKIADEGLRIFLDITVKCLHDRPEKRPIMVEVVAKMESALASQYTTYSSSNSGDDEAMKRHFGDVVYASSSANSDVDSLRHTVETGSGKSDSIKQDPSSELKETTTNRGLIEFKPPSGHTASGVPSGLQISQGKAKAPLHRTFTTSISVSPDEDNEYVKLIRRMNQPRLTADYGSCEKTTVIKVDSTNTEGILLEVVQVLIDFDLIITKASRTSDGSFFMDVFNVTDQEGNKVKDDDKILIKEVLRVYSSSTSHIGSMEISIPGDHTIIEFIGNDRPGLLSVISAILNDLQCNVINAEIWTHNTRVAAVMQVSDKETISAIIEPEKIAKIKKLLLSVLQGGNDNKEAKISVSRGCARFDRRLHQMMFADIDYEKGLTLNDKPGPRVDVVNYFDKDYSAVTIWCKNKRKILFDTICTLSDLNYFIFHGKFDTRRHEAYMEFWIRHINGPRIISEAERQRVRQCLEAAIERRVSEGQKVELCMKNRVGLLSEVTRIIAENSLSITRGDVTTTDDKAVFAFYVDDYFGCSVNPRLIDYVSKEIGQTIVQVRDGQLSQEYSTWSFEAYFKAVLGCFGFSQC